MTGGIVEVNALAAVNLKAILTHRCRALPGADGIAGNDRCFAVRSRLHPLCALTVVRVCLNLRAALVIARSALHIEVMSIRISAHEWVVANIGIAVQRLRVFKMATKTLRGQEPPHARTVIASKEVVVT